MAIVRGDKVCVSAQFDSGLFLHKFAVYPKAEDKNTISNDNLQYKYNLSLEDFEVLSAVICTAVDKYLELREEK